MTPFEGNICRFSSISKRHSAPSFATARAPTEALQFFLAYLPCDSKALGNNNDDDDEETRRCRRRQRSRLCRCSSALLEDRRSFIVVLQRSAALRRKSPGTAKRSRQIGSWVTCTLWPPAARVTRTFFRYSPS